MKDHCATFGRSVGRVGMAAECWRDYDTCRPILEYPAGIVLGFDFSRLLPLLPAQVLGNIQHVEPITLGLSGAGVYGVKASRGEFVLRVQTRTLDAAAFAEQLRILRRAAEARVAPAIVHVDEAALAVVSARIPGATMAAALADPAKHAPIIGSLTDQLRVLHALDVGGLSERDPITFIRGVYAAGRERPGFPAWCRAFEPAFDSIASQLAADPRRGLNHNDANPMNVLWDGDRVWLVDWEFSGAGHPYYDLATLALFLRFDESAVRGLLARHDGRPPDHASLEIFRALRKTVALLTGFTFLNLVSDLTVRRAETPEEAPSLEECHGALRQGQLDLSADSGRAMMGLAMLKAASTA